MSAIPLSKIDFTQGVIILDKNLSKDLEKCVKNHGVREVMEDLQKLYAATRSAIVFRDIQTLQLSYRIPPKACGIEKEKFVLTFQEYAMARFSKSSKLKKMDDRMEFVQFYHYDGSLKAALKEMKRRSITKTTMIR